MTRIAATLLLALGAFFTAALAGAQAPPAADAHATARQLVDLMSYQLKSGRMTDAIVKAQTQANPSLEPYADIISRWVSEIFGGPEFEDALVKLYEETFSADDLKAMLAFYNSPTGRRTIAMLPEVMQKSTTIGLDLVQRHGADLAARIKERAEQLNAAKPAPTTGDAPPNASPPSPPPFTASAGPPPCPPNCAQSPWPAPASAAALALSRSGLL